MSIRKVTALAIGCVIFPVQLILLSCIGVLCEIIEKMLRVMCWTMEGLERWGNKHV